MRLREILANSLREIGDDYRNALEKFGKQTARWRWVLRNYSIGILNHILTEMKFIYSKADK